jgi:hypothetical protein
VGGKLTRANGLFGLVARNHALTSQIPPPNGLVLTCSCQNVVVNVPDNGLDGSAVFSWSDLETFGSGAGSNRGCSIGLRGRGDTTPSCEIEDFELLVLSTGSNALRIVLYRECDGAYNVAVLKNM